MQAHTHAHTAGNKEGTDDLLTVAQGIAALRSSETKRAPRGLEPRRWFRLGFTEPFLKRRIVSEQEMFV